MERMESIYEPGSGADRIAPTVLGMDPHKALKSLSKKKRASRSTEMEVNLSLLVTAYF